MEILTIVLASFLSLGSGGGIVLDKIAQSQIRQQIISVEEQAIRIDNQPNYRAVQGRLARVRLASRGVRIEPGIRIAEIDLETDPLAVKLDQLELRSLERLREALITPATGAARLVLQEADLNQALESPEVRQQLQQILNRLVARRAGSNKINYEISEIQLDLRQGNRLQLAVQLNRPRSNRQSSFKTQTGTSSRQNSSRELAISLELTLKVMNGRTISLLNPQGTVNGRPMSPRLLNGFAMGISDRLDLNTLEADGILARILQLEINEDNLELVSFVRLETKQP